MLGELVLIDDDDEVLQLNCKYFQKRGYEVKGFSSGKKALNYLKENTVDCIVLDVMMPDFNGFKVCKEIKKNSNTPVIFLTGNASEDDKVSGLLLGAEDYMTKPYSLRELEARIMVQMRKNKKKTSENLLMSSSVTVDLLKHKVFYRDTEEIILSNREFDLLVFLMQHTGEAVSFETLGNVMWNHYTEADKRIVMVNMSRLRKKLAAYTGEHQLIETVWSVGYKFLSK